jgi:Fe-S-cluster containining protein
MLRQGLALLPPATRQEIAERLERLQGSARPLTCPFLDPHAGACLVYDHRPVACRTYGFYVERDRGLYCSLIESMVERHEMDGVVWGNQLPIEDERSRLGPSVPLVESFKTRF